MLKGRYGPYGGQYVPETLMSALEELEGAWREAWSDPEYQLEPKAQQHAFVGRPTPLYSAERLRPCVPAGVVYVAESGIHSAADAARMRRAGADAVLVGEALMRAPDPAAKLRELSV